jgi:hypothetical protein
MCRIARFVLGIGLYFATVTDSATAQPWDFYEDQITGEICDLVNATNVELVVLSDTGELVIVSNADLILGDSLVDLEGNVFYGGSPFGVITFAEDGDGFASLWWLSDFGTVVEFDLDLFLPFDSGQFPDEFVGVECDACPFWDVPEDCEVIMVDGDEDGLPDEDDLCPDTFPGEVVDVDGCSCEDRGDCDCFVDSDLDDIADCDDFCIDTPIGAEVDFDGCACFEVDDDGDGIDNCDDLCPNSPGNAAVDIDGCSAVIISPPPVSINCGSISALMLGLTFTGLFVMRFSGRRDW